MEPSGKKLTPKELRRQIFVGLIKLERAGVFSPGDALRFGISQPTLSRLVKRGAVKRVGSGFYIHRCTKLNPKYWAFAVACRKFGDGTYISGRSALYFHGLTEGPSRTWISVRTSQKSTNRQFRCFRTKSLSRRGVKELPYFRVTSLERTLVECLGQSRKIGRHLAYEALSKALSENRTTKARILQEAAELGMKRRIASKVSEL